MTPKFPLVFALAITPASTFAEPTRAGRAQVDWVSATHGYTPGKPLTTALKMVLDDGWHTYWINPGEAGMPLTATLTLPDGWSADAPQYPLPMRFMTGDLHDFGYEGTVLFPITLHPPADATGDVEIQGSFDWLTCDDSACVPGDAALTLTLKAGDDTPTAEAEEIAKTLKSIPTPAPETWKLMLSASEDSLTLTLELPPSLQGPDLEVFPLSVNVVHPAAKFDWRHTEGKWRANVPKSSFAPEPLETFELVIDAPSIERPAIVSWKTD